MKLLALLRWPWGRAPRSVMADASDRRYECGPLRSPPAGLGRSRSLPYALLRRLETDGSATPARRMRWLDRAHSRQRSARSSPRAPRRVSRVPLVPPALVVLGPAAEAAEPPAAGAAVPPAEGAAEPPAEAPARRPVLRRLPAARRPPTPRPAAAASRRGRQGKSHPTSSRKARPRPQGAAAAAAPERGAARTTFR